MIISTTDNDNKYSLTIMLTGSNCQDGGGDRERIPRNASVVNVDGGREEEDDGMVSSFSPARGRSSNVCKVLVGEESPAAQRLQAVEDCDVRTMELDDPVHRRDVLVGLDSLRRSGRLVDVTLWAEGRPHEAHKVVLASCSEYFRAMFSQPMRESAQRDVSLVGVPSTGLELVLQFIYSSKITLSLANIQLVLSTAAILRMDRILEACSDYLESQMDLENCLDIATLAERFCLTSLRQSAYGTMSRNLSRIKNLVVTQLSLQQLDTLLSAGFPVDLTETELLDYVLQWFSFNSKYCSDRFNACKLLKKINWKDVQEKDLRELLIQTKGTELLNVLLAFQVENDVVVEDDVISRLGLKNLRGMESALVTVGGFGLRGVTNRMSCFVPSQRRWSNLTNVPHVECSNFGCAVLNNSVYVVGGCFDQAASLSAPVHAETVHPFGFRYEPLSDGWTSIAPMLRERCRFTLTAAVSRNALIAVGGNGNRPEAGRNLDDPDFDMMGFDDDDGGDPSAAANCEAYDLGSNRWFVIAPIPRGNRSQHAACSVTVSGSRLRSLPLNPSNTFTRRFNQALLPPHDDQAWESDREFVLVSGGLDSTTDDNNHPQEVLDSMLMYDVADDAWFEIERRMPQPRADHATLVHRKRVLFVGGWTLCQDEDERKPVGQIDVYDLDTDGWQVETAIPTPKYHSGAAIVQDKLYVVGGFDRMEDQLHMDKVARGTVECYDLETKTWSMEQDRGKLQHPHAIWEHICQPLFVPVVSVKKADLHEE